MRNNITTGKFVPTPSKPCATETKRGKILFCDNVFCELEDGTLKCVECGEEVQK